MTPVVWLFLFYGFVQAPAGTPADAAGLFEHGTTLERFLGTAQAQRELWLKNASQANAPPDLVGRLKRVRTGLRFLIIAEDWCPDSVNTVPAIMRLASAAGIDARIVGRADGDPVMQRHRTPDGRTATPTVVFLRNGRDVGAWVERPAVLQKLFLSMAADPRNAEQFAQRQSWYDADRGRTTLGELVALAEQSAAR